MEKLRTLPADLCPAAEGICMVGVGLQKAQEAQGKVPSGVREAQLQLEQLGLILSTADIVAVGKEVLAQSYARGYYIHDPSTAPEPLAPPVGTEDFQVPVCLKRRWAGKYLPCTTRQDLREILAVARGERIPAGEATSIALEDVRRSPVEVRICLAKGCTAEVITDIGSAANAIRHNNLLEKKVVAGEPLFAPYTRCDAHRAERREVRDEKRESTKAAVRAALVRMGRLPADDAGEEGEAKAPTAATVPPLPTPAATTPVGPPPELIKLVAQQVTESFQSGSEEAQWAERASEELEALQPSPEDQIIAQQERKED